MNRKIFCDFGASFVVFDVNGQPSKCAMISFITNDASSVVTVSDEQRHDLEDGCWVTLREVKGMTEVNGREFQIKVLSNI